MDKKRNAAIWTGIALVITLVLGYLLIADIGLPGGRPLTTLSPRGDKSQNIQDLIIPVFAIAWGALFLGETLTLTMVLGCVVILAGTALASGFVGPRER